MRTNMLRRSSIALITSTGLVAVLSALPVSARAEACASAGPDGPMTITADCADPLYNAQNFVIDKVSEGTAPAPHTKVEAHFTPPAGQEAYKVSIYLPPREKFQGRFFQNAYPLGQPENVENIEFAFANGGYLLDVEGVMCGCGGYRPHAAGAKLAERYARDFYKTDKPIYGYVWGGSGGGLVTSGAAEHTFGVWDGIVPYVLPNAGSLANVNAAGALAGLALQGKLQAIAEAVAPGGSGDPFAGLTAEERAILQEALAIGTPLSTFESVSPFTGGPNPLLMILTAGVKQADPTYVEDFWTKPGYEGSNPPAYLTAALREEWATVTEVKRDDKGALVSVTLDRAPNLGPHPLAGISYEYWLYAPDGKTKVGELGGRLNGNTIVFQAAPGQVGQLGTGIEALMKRASLGAFDNVAAGQKVAVNNRNFLALHYYHRHAMPTDADFYTYDQYRGTDGSTKYAQRPYLASPQSAKGTAGGGGQTGKITNKVIVMQSMNDGGAQPWMADVYAKRVRARLGPKGYADNFRVYFNENAEHLDIPPNGPQGAKTINYVPALRQAVLDLSAWAERGVVPPASTRYTVKDSQVILPPTAAARKGFQPVVTLSVNGGQRIEVAAGQPVTFKGQVEVPKGGGRVTSTAWWFGEQPFALTPKRVAKPKSRVALTRTHTYNTPGTYFVTLWATSQRDGMVGDKLTAVENLDRVRVVVR